MQTLGKPRDGPARRAIEHAGMDATTEAIQSAFAEYRQADGSYRQETRSRYVISSP